MIMYYNEAIIKLRKTSILVNLLRQPHNMTKEKTKSDKASIY